MDQASPAQQQQQHAQPAEIFSPAASAAVQGAHQLEPAAAPQAPVSRPVHLLPLLVCPVPVPSIVC